MCPIKFNLKFEPNLIKCKTPVCNKSFVSNNVITNDYSVFSGHVLLSFFSIFFGDIL